MMRKDRGSRTINLLRAINASSKNNSPIKMMFKKQDRKSSKS